MDKRYSFLAFAAKVLRVVAWVILVGGILISIIASVTFGASLAERVGAASAILGVFLAITGIIFFFLAWVFLLATRELLYLLMDVEENTRNTAERIAIAKGSTQE